jgi:predicted transcriptional regulator
MTKKLRIGIASLADYRARTLAIARGEYRAAKDEPKVWFQSMESFAKVLSDKNRALLATIAETRPRSVSELAEKTGRKPSNLSRTLRTMERYGLVQFEEGEGRARIPRVPYSEITLDVQLAGRTT